MNFVQDIGTLELVENRKRWLVEYCAGRRVLHIGCVDSGLEDERLKSGDLLHGELVRVCPLVIGWDNDSKGLERLTSAGFGDLHCLDIQTGGTVEKLDLMRSHVKQVEVVLCSEVLEHLDLPGYFLATMKVKMPLGHHPKWVFTVPNAFSRLHAEYARFARELVHSDHRCWYSPYTLKNLLVHRGFTVERLLMYYHRGNPYEVEVKNHPLTAEGVIAICS